MPYARRDAHGQIASLHRQAEVGAQEYLPDDHAEVLAFVGHSVSPTPADAFAQLDADFVRVLEDVIDALVQRHVINITDLPAEAQRKLFSRKGYRERRAQHALELFGQADVSHLSGTGFGDLAAGHMAAGTDGER